jgi:hypothetical protein
MLSSVVSYRSLSFLLCSVKTAFVISILQKPKSLLFLCQLTHLRSFFPPNFVWDVSPSLKTCQFLEIGANQAQANEEGETSPEKKIRWYLVL